MSTTNKWLIGIGVVLLLVVMYTLPFVFQSTSLTPGGMMGGNGSGMMQGGRMGGNGGMMHNSGMMGNSFFGIGYGLMWIIPLSLLTLVGLGIAALIKYLRSA
jgi:hypothetical protein